MPVLLLAALLGGCGKEEVQVYRVPKDPPPRAARDNPHAGHAHEADPHGSPAARPQVAWKTPAGWEQRPGSAMRVAHFVIEGQDGEVADVGIIPLPGAGAKEADMVNMWRSELRLEAATPGDLARLSEPVEIGDAPGRLYDLVSTEGLAGGSKVRTIAAMLTRDETAWFFKMRGSDALVAAQKPAFRDFLKSISFAAAAPAAAPTAGMAAAPSTRPSASAPASAGDAPGRPTWTLPASWKEEPPTQMLVAKFAATEGEARAEVTVSVFPGDVGGLLANVNRWRRQISLPPIGEGELKSAVQELGPQPGQMTLVDIAGTDPKTSRPARLVGVVVPQGGQTWFYKLMGDDKVVAREKETLVGFVKGVAY